MTHRDRSGFIRGADDSLAFVFFIRATLSSFLSFILSDSPNVGTVVFDDLMTARVADIPGLIEGASQGVGMG